MLKVCKVYMDIILFPFCFVKLESNIVSLRHAHSLLVSMKVGYDGPPSSLESNHKTTLRASYGEAQ